MESENGNSTELLDILFPDRVADEYLENPMFHSCIHEVLKYNPDQIAERFSVIDKEINMNENEAKELVRSNYDLFAEMSDGIKKMVKDIADINQEIDNTVESIPKVKLECKMLEENRKNLEESGRLSTLMLNHNSSIMLLLEIPQLMTDCVRSKSYENALQLMTYVIRLNSQYGTNAPIIQDILNEVEKSWRKLMVQFICELSVDVTLPKCVEIMGYLRRMNVLSQTELRIKFLQARELWLSSKLSETTQTNDPNKNASELIESSRVHTFTIITQYKAIFNDDIDRDDFDTRIFYMWLSEKVQDFLDLLQTHLLLCAANSLDSLYNQCMYFGVSFARMGVDFRPLVAPVFIKTIENNFENAIKSVNEKFESDIDQFLFTISSFKPRDENGSGERSLVLLAYKPLATYYNGVMVALNDLRVCAFVSSVTTICQIMEKSLSFLSTVLLKFYDDHKSSENVQKVIEMSHCFANNLVPLVQKSLNTLYDSEQIYELLPFPRSYSEQKVSARLNVKQILTPIVHLVPIST